jgi:dTDP-4-amino-4,6-dideoxygalactose transaminase
MITVTRPFLPPLTELMPDLEAIWKSGVLTNGGAYHQAFESALRDYLRVSEISLFANATIALVTALQALRITGEVITTPFSFVATSHALLWNGIKPIFVDIDPKTLNIDVEKIESAITPQTTAILPVHCYGHRCNVEAIQHLADIYNLRVIYDAAHAFGVDDEGGSILRYGDLSIVSFHATKVFTTFEGGAIIAPDKKIKQRIDRLKNFGFVDEVTVVAPGINGKMNEFCAALGLLQLRHFEIALRERARVAERYRNALDGVRGIRVVDVPAAGRKNHSYFPILVGEEYPLSRDALYWKLRHQGIYARRYFYPLISNFPMYRALPSAAPDQLPVATRVAEQILCLPIYPDLSDADIDRVVSLIAE